MYWFVAHVVFWIAFAVTGWKAISDPDNMVTLVAFIFCGFGAIATK